MLSCRSVFYLPPPKPLNHLVQDLYRGPCMVLQGALDPLNDARARAAALQAACSNVEVQLIGGGHCPVRLSVHVCFDRHLEEIKVNPQSKSLALSTVDLLMNGAHALHRCKGLPFTFTWPMCSPEVTFNALPCSMMRSLPNLMLPCCHSLPNKHAAHTVISKMGYPKGRLLPQMWFRTQCQKDRRNINTEFV